nr:HEPN domain-containing protein [uncultured Clostridium sp.]
MSTQGKSFSRALILLQEARRTGVISSKIDKYCSILEYLYAINNSHKKNISNITAAYIENDQIERSNIITHMPEAYSVRSDKSHEYNLKYLKDNDERDLKKLSQIVDGYVRGVFIKTINSPSLNYGQDSESKAAVRKCFMDKAKAVYPDDYK